MSDSAAKWLAFVEATIAVGQPLTVSAEELDQACEHIVQLLKDASLLLESGSLATAMYLAITALEETAKVHIGLFRQSSSPIKRSKDPLYKHSEKHRLAAAPTVAMGSRLQAAIGESRMYELLELARNEGLIPLRESALYVERTNGILATPISKVSGVQARELLLLAVETFDDALVGYTLRSFELGKLTDEIFNRWRDV